MRTSLVAHVLDQLAKRNHEAVFFGPDEPGGETDWPVVTEQAARAVANGDAEEAIVICWTGTGASICANKVVGVRAALCADAETARGARRWNHANALALSIRKTTKALATEILDAWFDEPFTTDAWNEAQIAYVNAMESVTRDP